MKITSNRKISTTNSQKTKKLVILGLLAAIIILLNFTGLGYLQLAVISVTIVHVPVIIGTLLEGLKSGMVLGFLFGLFSCIRAYQTPGLLTACFMNPLVAILPRLMIPLVTYATAKALGFYQADKSKKKTVLSCSLASIAGSLANTVFVFLFIAIFYGDIFMQAVGAATKSQLLPKAVIFAATLGIPEALVVSFLCTAVMSALIRTKNSSAL